MASRSVGQVCKGPYPEIAGISGFQMEALDHYQSPMCVQNELYIEFLLKMNNYNYSFIINIILIISIIIIDISIISSHVTQTITSTSVLRLTVILRCPSISDKKLARKNTLRDSRVIYNE